jgi:hypothetical protein
MNNNLLQIKIKQRLNKLASLDYDNFECWQIQEAVNKAQIEWTRRQLYGYNIRKEGAEQSSGLVDDLQKLMVHDASSVTKNGIYHQRTLPDNYLHFVRTDVFGKNKCCDEKRIIVYQVEEANISIILDNDQKGPSWEWGETVATIMDGHIKIYTDDKFDITRCHLVYFRKPLEIQFNGCIDIKTGNVFTADQECEFNDDVAEIIVDQTAAILAGDIESMTQFQREQQAVQTNS